MIPANKTVEIYYLVDEFLKEYDAVIKSHSLEEGTPKKRRNGKFTMSNSENMTILILFHSSSFRNFKHFYIFIFVRAHMQKDFPHTASYNRFVELNERFGINALVFLLSMNALMLQHEKIMLRKRSLIETVNDRLKNVCQIEHIPVIDASRTSSSICYRLWLLSPFSTKSPPSTPPRSLYIPLSCRLLRSNSRSPSHPAPK